MSYSQANEIAEQIASAFIHFGLKANELVGIYARNRPEWVITDLACNAYSFVVLPFYSALFPFSEEAIHFILKQSKC